MVYGISEASEQQVEFKGKAGEWFGIWIINVLLSAVTLGIYSAWAKVRTKKYFYNNTYIAGRNFDYHATGKQILIGRIIAVVGFIVYSLLSAIPIVNILLLFALLVVFPYLIVRSIMFNARMSSWSNVRFSFHGDIANAFMVYILYPFLTLLTLYTTIPFLDRALKKFSINNHKLGSASFELDSSIGPFYKAFFIAVAWVVLVMALAGVLLAGSLAGGLGDLSNFENLVEENPAVLGMLIGSIYFFFFVAFLPAAFIYQAIIRNTVYRATTLDGKHKFRSSVKAGRMLWIAVSNMIAIVFTFGLMLPWAQIRLSKYLANNTFFIPSGSLDDFVSTMEQEGSAIGDAFTDLDSIDVGLPI